MFLRNRKSGINRQADSCDCFEGSGGERSSRYRRAARRYACFPGISLKSIGYIDGGADALIDLLLDAVGPRGTLIIPTYSQIYPLAVLDPDDPTHVFNPRTTPSYTGIVPERLRARPGAIRSRHPSNSVMAIGLAARRLTRDHHEMAGAYLPFSSLAELGGRFLGIGIGDSLVGLRHEAQARAGLLEILPCSLGIFYRDPRGRLQIFVRRDVGGCVKRLPELVPQMRAQGIIRDGSVGSARALLAEARPALEYSTSALLANPELNLCGEQYCAWCAALAKKIGKLRARPAAD